MTDMNSRSKVNETVGAIAYAMLNTCERPWRRLAAFGRALHALDNLAAGITEARQTLYVRPDDGADRKLLSRAKQNLRQEITCALARLAWLEREPPRTFEKLRDEAVSTSCWLEAAEEMVMLVASNDFGSA